MVSKMYLGADRVYRIPLLKKSDLINEPLNCASRSSVADVEVLVIASGSSLTGGSYGSVNMHVRQCTERADRRPTNKRTLELR